MSKISVKSRIAVFSTVVAVILATVSATSVFAASATTQTPAITVSQSAWGAQARELQTDRTFYSNLKSHPAALRNSNTPAQTQQYLNQFAFALKQAEAIILHGIPSANASVNVSSPYIRNLTAQQQLAMYLQMMRGLRTKLAAS
jgi:hypothetical protein